MNKPVPAALRRTKPLIINGERYLVVHVGPNRHQRRSAKHATKAQPTTFAQAMRQLAHAGRRALESNQ